MGEIYMGEMKIIQIIPDPKKHVLLSEVKKGWFIYLDCHLISHFDWTNLPGSTIRHCR